MIIDAHTHLGDILYPSGGKLIEKTGVKKSLYSIPYRCPSGRCTWILAT